MKTPALLAALTLAALSLAGCVSSGASKGGGEDLSQCLAGWRATQSGEWGQAIDLYESCKKNGNLSPGSLARTYRNLGITYRHKGEPQKAVESHTKALELSPRDPWDDYVGRGNAWSDAKDYDKALADYAKALELRPDYDQAIYNRGIVYERQGKKDEAYADFQQAYALGLRSPEVMNRLTTYKAEGHGSKSTAGGPFEKVTASYKVGPAKPVKKLGEIWQSSVSCHGGAGFTADDLQRYPDADIVRKAGAFEFPTSDIRVAFPELPYLATPDVRIQLNDTSRGVRDDYLSFSDAPLQPVYAAVVRTELPKNMRGHTKQIHDAILQQVTGQSAGLAADQMSVRDIDGPWGPVVEVLVLNRAGTMCFPTSEYKQLPPDAPGSTVSVSRYVAKSTVLIEIALIVRIPPEVPKAQQVEYARERMNEFMGSIQLS